MESNTINSAPKIRAKIPKPNSSYLIRFFLNKHVVTPVKGRNTHKPKKNRKNGKTEA